MEESGHDGGWKPNWGKEGWGYTRSEARSGDDGKE